MSVIIASKRDKTVVLATDSRSTDGRGKPLSNNQEKIFEIAPSMFYTASGLLPPILEQAKIAASLARSVDLKNPQDFADQLDRASQPLMEQVVALIKEMRSLRPDKYYEEQLSGGVIHGYVIAGISDGRPGFIYREFRCINGPTRSLEHSVFDLPAGNFSTINTRGKQADHLVHDPATWKGGHIHGVERLVNHMCSVHPECGGPTQMVYIYRTGSRWVHCLPVEASEAITRKDLYANSAIVR
jgi:hypothetical protein